MFTYLPLNEYAITIYDHESNQADHLNTLSDVEQRLIENPFPGFIETSLAYISLTIYYDPMQIEREYVIRYIQHLSTGLNQKKHPHQKEVIDIPVYYDTESGPDLGYVAAYNDITIQEVIQTHTSQVYKVHMIGFMPGFPYLSGLSERIATPRKETPRPNVPAGSVGIAGTQTGIYPLNSPGGWQIIGRTPFDLFDMHRNPPALLRAGQYIRFKAVTKSEFENLLN